MKIIITGGSGFLGSQLAAALLKRAELTGPSGKPEPIDAMVLIDAHFPVPWIDPRLVVDLQQRKGLQKMRQIVGDISNRDVINEAIGSAKNISIFHLASMVSGECEDHYDDALRAAKCSADDRLLRTAEFPPPPLARRRRVEAAFL